jgi:hypothetical protein
LRAGLAIVGGYPIPGGTEHFQTLLGAALVGQARGLKKADPGAAKRLLDEAEPLLLESYLELRSDTDASGDFKQGWVPESLQRLIDFYHEADRSDEAAKWQAEFDLSNSQPANHN